MAHHILSLSSHRFSLPFPLANRTHRLCLPLGARCHRSTLGCESFGSSSIASSSSTPVWSCNLPCAIAAVYIRRRQLCCVSLWEPVHMHDLADCSLDALFRCGCKGKQSVIHLLPVRCSLSAVVNLCTKRRSEPLLSPLFFPLSH